MTQQPLLIGPNYPIINSLFEVVSNNPYYTCQVTVGNDNISKADRDAVALHCRQSNQSLFIHTHLHNNLAKVDASTSLRRLKKDIGIIRGSDESVRIPGAAVLHVGKACDQTPKGKKPTTDQRASAIETVTLHLNELMPLLKTKGQPVLLLENAAGQGTEIGGNWDDFRRIAEGLDQNYLGLCLDTQHAFASGVTAWSTYEETNRVLDQVGEVGFRLGLIHLNDSKVEFGRGVDRHESIGQGYIWTEDQESLVELLARCAEEAIPIVLETPTQMKDLDYIYTNFVRN